MTLLENLTKKGLFPPSGPLTDIIMCTNIGPYYSVFHIPKKSGGKRIIEAPSAELKDIQRRFLYKYLTYIKPDEAAYGFVKGVQMKSGAEKHCGAKVLLNIDLKNFFHSFKSKDYKSTLIWMANDLYEKGLIAESNAEVVSFLKKIFFLNGRLPMGSPLSPQFSNIGFRPVDASIRTVAKSFNVEYSRYADDLSFSSKDGSIDMLIVFNGVKRLLSTFRKSLFINNKKTRILRAHKRIEVTGVTVNVKTGVSKKIAKNIRAAIHNYKIQGVIPEKEFNKLTGFSSWIYHLNPEKGASMLSTLRGLEIV